MQGRLSPAPVGRPQVFPVDGWRQEFAAARACGFDGIEWLVTEAHLERNPLLQQDGRREIRACVEDAGMPLLSACADVLIARRLVRAAAADRQAAQRLLLELVEACGLMGIPRLVVPILESATPTNAIEIDELCAAVAAAAAAGRAAGVTLLLESDLLPEAVAALLTRLSGVQLCLDTGNCAARMGDPSDEVRRFSGRVGELHIKDRPRGGANVPLGEGAVDFVAVAVQAHRCAPGVPLILETTVGDDPLESARRNLSATRAWFTPETLAS